MILIFSQLLVSFSPLLSGSCDESRSWRHWGVQGWFGKITDGGPPCGHVQIIPAAEERVKMCLQSSPTSHSSYLHPLLQVKWDDLMCGPVGEGNGVGGWARDSLSISKLRGAVGDWDPLLRCAPCMDRNLLSSPPHWAVLHTSAQNTHLISSACAPQWNLCLHSSLCSLSTGPVGDWWSLLLTDGSLSLGVLFGPKLNL